MAEQKQQSACPLPDNQPKSSSKRLTLILASYITFAVGAVLALIPFGKSFLPSRRAVAVGAPVDVDVSDMQPGELRVVKWRGKPVWIVRRTEEMVASLSLVTDLLSDPQSKLSEQPQYAKNEQRSKDAEWLVMVGVCTHLGCSPLFKPGKGSSEGMKQDWQGGFFCPCHGSHFDLAGRVFKNNPAPTNMPVPDYYFVENNVVRIGEAEGGVA